jgi:hypothetical protein
MHLNKKDTEWCEAWNGSERVRIIRPMMAKFKKNGNEPSGSIRAGILDKLNVFRLVEKTHASRVNQLLGSLVMPLPDENTWFVKIRLYL